MRLFKNVLGQNRRNEFLDLKQRDVLTHLLWPFRRFPKKLQLQRVELLKRSQERRMLPELFLTKKLW